MAFPSDTFNGFVLSSVVIFISISLHSIPFCFVLFSDAHIKSLGSRVFIALHDTDNNRTAKKGVKCRLRTRERKNDSQPRIKWKAYNNLPWNYIQMKVSNSLFSIVIRWLWLLTWLLLLPFAAVCTLRACSAVTRWLPHHKTQRLLLEHTTR